MSDIIPLLRMTMYLIDVVSSLQLSEKGRQAVRNGREALERQALRERAEERLELLEKRKEEKKKSEEEKFDRMTPEKQRLHEEKLHKKELKQSRMRIRVL
eukprot:GHVQ01027516.1.p3 GENE.GHVQ01027516.1~~GHVQ01027516.1.p3  ORF type:complete len:100 (+),score=26.19 GHVQ01027516.1:123-422(+)